MNTTPLTPNTVLFTYLDHSITQNEVGDTEVINGNGDSLYICLDDSKIKVKPHLPNNWMDRTKDSIGYDINFTNYFYKYKTLRSLNGYYQ
jgi:hypothetical protein